MDRVENGPFARASLNVAFFSVLAGHLVLNALLISPYVNNADTISYISIAQKYLRADYGSAVSGHWAPVFCWLMIPFLAVKVNPVIAAKLVLLLNSIPLLAGIYLISSRMRLRPALRVVLPGIYVPFLVWHNALIITPDILVITPFLFYLYFLLDERYVHSAGPCLLSGLLGGLAYLTKHFSFLIFLVHFSSCHVLWYFLLGRGEARRFLARRYLQGLAVFLAVSVSWAALISLKYGRPTISTAGAFNFSLLGTKVRGGFPHEFGIVPPPDDSAVSAWEDPAKLPAVPWNPLASSAHMKAWLKEAWSGLTSIVGILNAYSILSIPILLTGLILAVRSSRHSRLFILFLAMAVTSLGYSLILVKDRYLWINEILILLIGGYALTLLLQSGIFSKKLAAWILIPLLSAPFLGWPLHILGKARQGRLYMDPFGSQEQEVYRESLAVAKILAHNEWQHRGSAAAPPPLAELRPAVASCGNWNKGLFISYYLNLRYYGNAASRTSPGALKNDLVRSEIDYLFCWYSSEVEFKFLEDYFEITRGTVRYLRIFDLRRPRR